MRKMLFMTLLCFVIVKAPAQQPATNPFPKTITVSGSAEMEVIPDEIYVNISLREYQKKGESKKQLETIKADFLKACSAAGLPDSVISIQSYSGNNNYFSLRRKARNPDLNTGITYQVKFSGSKQMDDLVDRLDDEATMAFSIVSTSHSKITEYRKQLKIEAIKAAKVKALYLAEAIGEKAGAAITITEPDTISYGGFTYGLYNTIANSNYNLPDSVQSNGPAVDFRKLKLHFEVTVVFALQ
ncbi:MAG: SIMPL domain-containing protein [Chitinophagaceae bacterium]